MFGNHQQLCAPGSGVQIEFEHGLRASEILDVDETRLLVVEWVDDIDDPKRIRASPIHDLATDRQVDVLVKRTGQVDLARVELPLVDIEHFAAIAAAPLDAIHEVVPADGLDAHLPFMREPYVELEKSIQIESREIAIARRAANLIAVGNLVIEVAVDGTRTDRPAQFDVLMDPIAMGKSGEPSRRLRFEFIVVLGIAEIVTEPRHQLVEFGVVLGVLREAERWNRSGPEAERDREQHACARWPSAGYGERKQIRHVRWTFRGPLRVRGRKRHRNRAVDRISHWKCEESSCARSGSLSWSSSSSGSPPRSHRSGRVP